MCQAGIFKRVLKLFPQEELQHRLVVATGVYVVSNVANRSFNRGVCCSCQNLFPTVSRVVTEKQWCGVLFLYGMIDGFVQEGSTVMASHPACWHRPGCQHAQVQGALVAVICQSFYLYCVNVVCLRSVFLVS